MQYKEAKEIIDRYNAGVATEEEKALVESWYAQLRGDDVLISEQNINLIKDEIYQSLPIHFDKAPVRLWPRIAAAASILLFLSISSYFLFLKQPGRQTAQNQIQDILPGGDKAILRAHGKTYRIDNAKNGLITQQGTTIINKTANGQLMYSHKAGGETEAMVYDTLTIPRAGQYQLKLADGSLAWLNANTKMRYPERFTGNERVIELISGEAYIEVVHNEKMPFKINVKGQTISDIGTHFNINAYDDEPIIKTSLIEGCISVSKGSKTVILKPGQESIVQPANNTIVVHNGNPEEAIAWKNGYFRFNNEDIQGIMRQLSRWYNIDVAYQGSVPTDGFNGKISRFKNISQVLRMLESTKLVHFKIEGRRVTVIP